MLGPLLKGVPTLSQKGKGHALEEAFPAEQFYALYEKQAGWFVKDRLFGFQGPVYRWEVVFSTRTKYCLLPCDCPGLSPPAHHALL